jgi:hypothetical protein
MTGGSIDMGDTYVTDIKSVAVRTA